MPGDAEEVQEIGRRGVATLKRWLEATTFIELPYDAYNHSADCVVTHLTGRKTYDLSGYYLTGTKRPITIESKRYSSAGGQYKEYQHFLSIAYSATVKEIGEVGSDRGRHYMWVTYHPFSLTNWSELESKEEMRKALSENGTYLAGRTIDDDVLTSVAGRVTVLVFNPKQEAISLTKEELCLVRTVINRKAQEL